MEKLRQILTKPLLVLLLIIQCAFLVFVLISAPKANGELHTAISNLRTPSQSNIAPINQNDAKELRVALEQHINNNKFMTMVSVLFSVVSIIVMGTMIILPLEFKRAAES